MLVQVSAATSTASGHVATAQVAYSATVPETISFNDNLTAGALLRCTLCVSLTEKESHEIIVQIFGVPTQECSAHAARRMPSRVI
ncbi:exported hypothetical protein [Frankia sp. Hr75.2]|nr:exported hypothetical protein [Frankia sp. Hr75.2]